LTPEGDTKHEWDTTNESDLAQARLVFEEYQKLGYTAFLMSDTEKASPLTEFDPTAKTLLFVPLLVGG
jgi:hypothetical protein